MDSSELRQSVDLLKGASQLCAMVIRRILILCRRICARSYWKPNSWCMNVKARRVKSRNGLRRLTLLVCRLMSRNC